MMFDFSNFHVITLGKASKSLSELKITTKTLSFSMLTAAELGYPEKINILASPDATKLVVCAVKSPQYEKTAVPFCKPSTGRNKKMISLRAQEFVRLLRERFSWDDNAARKVYGSFFRQEGLIVFDLTRAFLPGDKTMKHAPLELNDYPTFKEIQSTYRAVLALPESIAL